MLDRVTQAIIFFAVLAIVSAAVAVAVLAGALSAGDWVVVPLFVGSLGSVHLVWRAVRFKRAGEHREQPHD